MYHGGEAAASWIIISSILLAMSLRHPNRLGHRGLIAVESSLLLVSNVRDVRHNVASNGCKTSSVNYHYRDSASACDVHEGRVWLQPYIYGKWSAGGMTRV